MLQNRHQIETEKIMLWSLLSDLQTRNWNLHTHTRMGIHAFTACIFPSVLQKLQQEIRPFKTHLYSCPSCASKVETLKENPVN